MYPMLFLHSSVGGCLGDLYLLVTNAAGTLVDTYLCASLPFASFASVPRSATC